MFCHDTYCHGRSSLSSWQIISYPPPPLPSPLFPLTQILFPALLGWFSFSEERQEFQQKKRTEKKLKAPSFPIHFPYSITALKGFPLSFSERKLWKTLCFQGVERIGKRKRKRFFRLVLQLSWQILALPSLSLPKSPEKHQEKKQKLLPHPYPHTLKILSIFSLLFSLFPSLSGLVFPIQ